jgi:predicted Zn-ribbon and HTH transcriptional regulator
MDTKEQIENVVFHQTQCLNALEDMKKMIETHHEDSAINKLKDLEKELTRLTIQLREIEATIE